MAIIYVDIIEYMSAVVRFIQGACRQTLCDETMFDEQGYNLSFLSARAKIFNVIMVNEFRLRD